MFDFANRKFVKSVAVVLPALGLAGITACSSGGSGGPAGISGASCHVAWTFSGAGDSSYPTYKSAYAAALAMDNNGTQNDTPEAQGNVPYEFPSISFTPSSTADVNIINVTYYAANGNIIGSDGFQVGEDLAAGQKWTQSETDDQITNQSTGQPAMNVSSCAVTGWTPLS